ncbi:unnamed protein product [Blepharisma stoltei]|uniref:SEC7 domain-containing protein n=1 Tax=Blepharisma stoltei TaxID=1481888 RepID=A0AAU9KD81_9CILI|nr:unnamed protein product [Blepharisma stoltei]
MGNANRIDYTITQNRHPGCTNCLGCSELMLDGGELAIHQQVGIPRGRIIPESLKYLTNNELQLLQAAGTKNLSSIRWYLSQGISPNTYDENRTSPLHIAARQGSLQIIQELLNKGAFINLTDCAGWTPLHVASYYGREQAVTELLSYGADFSLVNRRGETPCDIARTPQTREVFNNFCKDSSQIICRKKTPNLALDLSAMEVKNFVQDFKDGRTSKDRSPTLEEPSEIIAPINWIFPGISSLIVSPLISTPTNELKLECIKLFNLEPLRGLTFMLAMGVLGNKPQEVSKYFLTEPKLSKSSIGFILGEINNFYKEVAFEFMKQLGLKGINIVVALRKVFSHLILPEEGGKITHILQAFGNVFSKQNCQFGSPEAIQSLSFSIIMLDKSIKQHNPIDKENFITTNSGLRDGKDYPEGILNWIYDEVSRVPVIFPIEDPIDLSLFDILDFEGIVTIKERKRHMGLFQGLLIFFGTSKVPYACLVLKGAEISENWLTHLVTISHKEGMETAKLSKEGRMKTRKEKNLAFKSENSKKWIEVLNAAASCNTN